MQLKPQGIRDFAERDWGEVQRLKDRVWLQRKARSSPEQELELAGELWTIARGQHPTWPTPEDRKADRRDLNTLLERLWIVSKARERR